MKEYILVFKPGNFVSNKDNLKEFIYQNHINARILKYFDMFEMIHIELDPSFLKEIENLSYVKFISENGTMKI